MTSNAGIFAGVFYSGAAADGIAYAQEKFQILSTQNVSKCVDKAGKSDASR